MEKFRRQYQQIESLVDQALTQAAQLRAEEARWLSANEERALDYETRIGPVLGALEEKLFKLSHLIN